MYDRYVEKSFLLLLVLSLLLHIGLFAGLYFFPGPTIKKTEEPVFIDLQQMPKLKQPPEKRESETKRQSEAQIRVPKESAPRGDSAKDSIEVENKSVPPPRAENAQASKPSRGSERRTEETPAPGYSAASLFKPKSEASKQAAVKPNLFPGISRLKKLEDGYRRKFEKDIAEGDTRFLNSDDIMFGSFLRRFEGAIYGVWRYPQEAALRGIEGITPVRITFNRQGEITNVTQLESSGARILDEEVLRTLRAIGPVGGFPKGYDKDEFHLIAFFQYGGSGRSLR